MVPMTSCISVVVVRFLHFHLMLFHALLNLLNTLLVHEFLLAVQNGSL
jgi:hypothetical protein